MEAIWWNRRHVYVLLNTYAVFWPLSPPKCVHPKDCSYQLDLFSICSAIYVRSIQRDAQKAGRCCSFWDIWSTSERLDLVCLHALHLYLHESLFSQLWGRNCERRGQHWHLTHFISQQFILKCLWVQVVNGRMSVFSHTVTIFVYFFSSEVSQLNSCQTPLNLGPVVCNNILSKILKIKKYFVFVLWRI